MTKDFEFGEESVARLLAGDVSSDVPAGYAGVAAVMAAAAAPVSAAETEGAQDAARRLAAAVPARSVSFGSFRRRIVVVGLAGALVLTGSLAAAGALPDSAQNVAHDVLNHVGIHVPGPNSHAGNHPFERGKSGKTKKHRPGPPGTPPGKAATSPSKSTTPRSHPTHP
ncbi:MAG: hypothetical protein ABR548_11140 [Actinomycetota bacterium]|nr:hypothetical protein [Actinomycetota bacterium]